MQRRPRYAGPVAALLLLAVAAPWAFSSGTYRPPLPARSNKVLLTGEKLWTSSRLVGPGGETCAGCHDSPRGPALDRHALARKREDLPKLVFWEIVTHSKNSLIKPGGDETTALVAYLRNRYRLDEPLPAAAPDGSAEAVARARRDYLAGEYDRAVSELTTLLAGSPPPAIAAEGYILLGSIHQLLGREAQAVEAFTEVFHLFPEASIDVEVFSPKTVELFEAVRRASFRAQGSPGT